MVACYVQCNTFSMTQNLSLTGLVRTGLGCWPESASYSPVRMQREIMRNLSSSKKAKDMPVNKLPYGVGDRVTIFRYSGSVGALVLKINKLSAWVRVDGESDPRTEMLRNMQPETPNHVAVRGHRAALAEW